MHRNVPLGGDRIRGQREVERTLALTVWLSTMPSWFVAHRSGHPRSEIARADRCVRDWWEAVLEFRSRPGGGTAFIARVGASSEELRRADEFAEPIIRFYERHTLAWAKLVSKGVTGGVISQSDVDELIREAVFAASTFAHESRALECQRAATARKGRREKHATDETVMLERIGRHRFNGATKRHWKDVYAVLSEESALTVRGREFGERRIRRLVEKYDAELVLAARSQRIARA